MPEKITNKIINFIIPHVFTHSESIVTTMIEINLLFYNWQFAKKKYSVAVSINVLTE